MRGLGLLSLLLACTTEDMKTRAAKAWCQKEDDCNDDIYFPSGPVEGEQCRRDYVTEAEKYLSGCKVDWGKFAKAESAVIDAECNNDYEQTGRSIQDYHLDPEVLPSYCSNYNTATGEMYATAKKAKR
jgi:hypothetical protein